jgi:hypothetical protein
VWRGGIEGGEVCSGRMNATATIFSCKKEKPLKRVTLHIRYSPDVKIGLDKSGGIFKLQEEQYIFFCGNRINSVTQR